MKLTINNVTAEGTPQEVFNLLQLMGHEPAKSYTPKSPFTYVSPPNYVAPNYVPKIFTTPPPNGGSTSCTIPIKYRVPVSMYWTNE